ncbi:winged helix-turn-helix domain-containing protein [Phytohalomonas tamaricis]|uniref:winged helix-turn-helix domain-containing protein n=1 Tax=Phytohalomonas tamaricis TaxID=2081032 RepID=UPI000D0BD6DD|nr:crosslink repair DNA glycosylase YcaQ family protein [Phytohalomonas tamaricis]
MIFPTHSLSQAEARRIALAAQGFANPPPAAVDERAVEQAFAHIKLVQIDSVNVLVRSHYLPLMARLGPYATELIDHLAYGENRRLFEYWGHEASLIPVEFFPLLRWRMERAARGEGIYSRLARFAEERGDYIESVFDELVRRGPLSARELSSGGPGRGSWWGWSDGKRALEYLFWAGRVTTAYRRGFERVYELTERVLPQHVLAAKPHDEATAQRELMRHASKALGVASELDLRDYFRLSACEAKRCLHELIEDGALTPVEIEGWSSAGYLAAEARSPKSIDAEALLSPFDSLVWQRQRNERLFNFHYRLEFYVPAAKRRYGYYVLPVLSGENLVGRVDLKADRQARTLRVISLHAENGVDDTRLTEVLARLLIPLMAWLKLDRINVVPGGALAALIKHHCPDR